MLIGYALAFGSGNIFIGYSHFLILDLDPSGYAFFFFQVFCKSSLDNNSSRSKFSKSSLDLEKAPPVYLDSTPNSR